MPDRSVYVSLALMVAYLSLRDAPSPSTSITSTLLNAEPTPSTSARAPVSGVQISVLNEAGDVVSSSSTAVHSLSISYCGSCGYGAMYAKQRTELISEFPTLRVDGSIHPTPAFQAGIAKVATALSWGSIIYGFAGEKLWTQYLHQPEPSVLATLRTNLLYRMGLFFVLNQVSARMGNSGAYEVSLDGTLIYSKLTSGTPPSTAALSALIRESVLNAVQ